MMKTIAKNPDPAWANAQRRLIWGGWMVLVVAVSLLFGVYLYSVRDQVREAVWSEGRAAARMLKWRLQAQMQHLDDVMLHTCESFERLGPGLTEKDALFKGRSGTATPYEQLFILGAEGESMLLLPQSTTLWGGTTWVERARQHAMGQIFTMVLSRDGKDLLTRVLPVWSETGKFKGAVVGVLSVDGLDSIVQETAQAYGLNLAVLHHTAPVVRSPQQPAAFEDVEIFREQVQLPAIDLVLDFGLQKDAVLARWAMAWQWLVLIWALIVLCLSCGARWLNTALTRQVRTLTKLKTEQEAAKVRSGFLANMSHELRTPMMGVLGAAELLEGADGQDQSRYLRMIRDSGRHLLGLLNNVLDFSRLEAGAMPLELQEVAPLALLEQVAQSFSPQAEVSQVALYAELDLHRDLRVRLDGFRLSQVVSNLMGNAFKFTHQGWIRIQAGLDHGDNQSMLWIKITDTGIGVSADEQTKLFKPFSQADESTSRRYGGSGLGLVIVQQLLNLMGGTMRFQSTQGLGTEVWLAIPIEIVQAGKTGSSLQGFCHLAIEDDLLRSTVACHLKQLGVSVCTEPLTEVLRPALRVVDEKNWIAYSKSETQIADTPWLVVWGVGVAPDISAREGLHVSSMHALQSRDDWCEFINICKEKSELSCKSTPRATGVSVPRILVAEDNETTRQILALYFSATNYEIDFAPDGKVALELWREKKYDLVILDCHMPGIDGFAVAEEIRIHEPVSRKTPLMALTAATMQEDVERCIKAGMDEVWSKPISKMQLLGNIQRLLN
jgi:signal transduction histidine kinase/CheY-like chemotaxis protein